MPLSEILQVGDTVQLSGGYSFEPDWLAGAEYIKGLLIAFIPGQNETSAALVKVDHSLTNKGVTGDILVLELRYVDAIWSATGIVHVELCDFTPEPKAWRERRKGVWVESHATHKRQAG